MLHRPVALAPPNASLSQRPPDVHTRRQPIAFDSFIETSRAAGILLGGNGFIMRACAGVGTPPGRKRRRTASRWSRRVVTFSVSTDAVATLAVAAVTTRRDRRHGIPGGIAAHDGLAGAPDASARKLAKGSSPPGATRRRHPRRPPCPGRAVGAGPSQTTLGKLG